MSNYLSIKEIGKQETWEGKKISIPAIQRGLVWNAKQVEYLWDSILRGFPVGGFVVLEDEKTLDLLDGQQRCNAIKLAFVEPSEADSEVLWWDIRQNRGESSRKYFVKVVSKEQPWGYDEDCSLLRAQEKRAALKDYFGDEKFNVYKDDFEISKVFPFKAQFPIPMSFFLKTNNLDELINKIETLPDSWKDRHWDPDKSDNHVFLREKYKFFKSKIDKLLGEYSIPLSVLSKDLLYEDDTDPQENSAIEVLFNRLGSMGTRITNEDLAYSAIKSYWPKEIKEKNEELAAGLLPPQVLISLLFRLILTEENANPEENANQLTRGLSINEIRNIARNEDKKKSIIGFFESEEPDRIISLLKDCLAVMNIPPDLIVKMGRDIPDAILLIMWIIHKYEIKDLGKQYLAGLLLLLLWFGNKGKITSIVDNLYSIIQRFQSKQFDSGAVSHAVYSMMGFEWISVIYSPKDLETLTDGDKVINELENNPMSISLSGLWWDKSMLLYAQREFLNVYFPLYNPMRWKEDNRPWDYDHILPQSWVSGKKGVAQTFKDWAYTIGNLAAIPFQVNRSKNDKHDYEFYKENQESLFFKKRFESFTPESVKDKEKACIFAKTVFDRFVSIYRECYNAISILLSGIEADGAKKAKDMYEGLKEGMQENKHNLKARFVLAGLEYDIVNPVDWNRQWISFEYDLNNYCVASISFSKMNNNQADSEYEYEIGLRKHPLLLNISDEWRKNNKQKILKIAEKAGLQEEGGQGWWYILKTCKSFEEAKAFEEAKECFYKIIEAKGLVLESDK